MNLVCLRKNAPIVEDFIRYCGHETALKITNRVNQINGSLFDIFSSKEFNDSVDKYGMTETFHQIEEAYKDDRLNRFFNLNTWAGIEDDSILIEMNNIREKAIKDGKIILKKDGTFDYALAPNDERSNLNEGQWLQVRTKAFKEWFGDWIKGLSVNQDNNSFYRGQFDEPYIDDNGNLILYGRKDSLYEKAVYKESKGVSVTRNLKSAAEYGEGQFETRANLVMDNSMDESEQNAVIDNGYYIIQFKDSVSNKEIKEAGESKLIGDITVPKGSYVIEHYVQGELIETIGNIDNSDASKIVDENGEPLVVYHNTNTKNNITTFDKDKTKQRVFYFKTWEDTKIINYIFRSKDVPVFLNIKNPLIIDKKSKVKDGFIQSIKTIQKYLSNDNDGVIGFVNPKMDKGQLEDNKIVSKIKNDGIEIVTFESNQIKSATDNNGEFSEEDDNIYKEHNPRYGNQQRDQRLFNLINEGGSYIDVYPNINDIIDIIEQNQDYKHIVNLLKQLSDKNNRFLKGLKIKVTSPSMHLGGYSSIWNRTRAFYNSDTKTIEIDATARYENADASSVLLHEIMHHLTIERLATSKKHRDALTKIFNEYKQYDKLTYFGDRNKLEEFVADIWSNPIVVNKLKSIKSHNETLWDKIKRFFKNIISGLFGNTKSTLFQDAANELISLLEVTPSVKVNNGIYLENLEDTSYVSRNDTLQDMLNEEWGKFSKEDERLKEEFAGAQLVYTNGEWFNKHNMSLTDYNVIKQAVIDKVSQQLSMFLYEFNTWAYIHNIDVDSDTYKKLKQISDNGALEKFLSINTFTFNDLFFTAIRQLLKSRGEKKHIFQVLNLSEDGIEDKEFLKRKALISFLKSQVRNNLNSLYNLSINDKDAKSVISIDELDSEDDLDIYDMESIEEETESNFSEGDEEAGPQEDFDAIGTMLALQNNLNFDRVKKDKQLIIQLFSGIPNVNKNRISPYGNINYYNPWTIYNELIKTCHYCKNSDELKERLQKNTRYPYTRQIVERMNQSPQFATRVWRTFRGQYRIFYDISKNEDGTYKLTFPNFKYGNTFYKYAILNFINRDKDNIYFYLIDKNNKEIFGYRGDHRKVIEPLVKLLQEYYTFISNNFIESDKNKSFTSQESYDKANQIKTVLNKPFEISSLGSNAITFLKELNSALEKSEKKSQYSDLAFGKSISFIDLVKRTLDQLGTDELGLDITDTEILSVFTAFTFDSKSYKYKEEGKAFIDKIYKAVTKSKPEVISSLYDYMGRTLDVSNSFVLSNDTSSKLISHFYRGKDGYYSFGDYNKLARRSDWLNSLSNEQYVEWYNNQLTTNNYFAAYHSANEFFQKNKDAFPELKANEASVHNILYNLYKKAIDETNRGYGASKLISSNIKQIPDFSHIFFAVQDDKKFNELAEFGLTVNKIASFLNKSSGIISDTRSLYPIYSLSDKNQSVAFVNERDNNLQLCVNSLASKTIMELIRMRNIYTSIANNKLRKDTGLDYAELTFEPGFSAEIDDSYKINFDGDKNGGIRFAYLPELNKYLYAINNTEQKNKEVFSEDECEFIKNLHTYIYSHDAAEIDNAQTSIYFSLVGTEKLHKQTSRIKFARNGIITKVLNEEADKLEKKILSCPGLVNDLGFKKNTATNKLKEDTYILKDRVSKKGNKSSDDDFSGLNLPTLLKYFLYNSSASLAEQTFIFHDDIVRYGSAKTFTKRANEIITSGQEVNNTAHNKDGNLYDQREGELRGKKVCITWGNVKSNSFIRNKQFFNDMEKILTTQGNAKTKSRKDKVNANKKSILNDTIEAADGQSMISLAYKKRYLGQLGTLLPIEETITDKLIEVFDTVSNYIENDEFDKIREYERKVIDPLYKIMWKVGYTPSSIKQFASTVLNNSDNRRSTATQRKNSEVCVEDIKTLLEQKNYFMIRLMAHMNRNKIDCIDDPTTVKEGNRKEFNPAFEDFFEEFDNIFSTDNEGNLIFDRDLVNLIPEEDVALVQETKAHAMDREDIFGTQVTRIIPSTIDRTGNTKYCLYEFGQNDSEREITGDWLYNAIQKVFDLRIIKSIENVKRRFGITKQIEDKINSGKELTNEETMRLNKAFSSILKGSSKFSDTDYRFILSPVDGRFIYPVTEFTSTTELSKTIASVLKRDIIANNVPGGQLVQVTSVLNKIFYKLKNNEALDEEDKKALDDTLECKVTYYEDGKTLKEVYMEAEIPFMYKDAVGEYITEDENGVLTIDMNKVPEELKHGIFYRIPTEGLCSIFHIKVKRFTYGTADHIKLPAEIVKLSGADFDIDKLYAFIASMKKDEDGKLTYVKPDLDNLENNTSKEMLNNALFELMLTALNSPTGVNGYIEFGGYDDIKYEGLAITLATIEYQSQKGNDKQSLSSIYEKYKNKSHKELANIFANFNKNQSPCSVTTNIEIQSTNFESKDLLGISANNNALSAELSQLEVYLNTDAFKNGVQIGNSKIISGERTKYAPKYTVSGNELCSNNIRQPLAAAADTGKDSFLSFVGFNKFSIGIWNGLMNLGCEREDALLFIQHPVIRHLAEEYAKEEATSEFPVTPMTIIKHKSYIGKNKSKNSSYDDVFLGQDKKIFSDSIKLDRGFLISSLESDYQHFIRNNPNENASIERFLYFLLKNNNEMVQLSPLLKIDSKSNVSWNTTFGLIAMLTNYNTFRQNVINGKTTFDDSILDVFDNTQNENSIPRLSTILNSMPNLVSLILNQQNPHLFNKLKEITFDIGRKVGKQLSESDIKDIYDSYNLILAASEKSKLAPYLNVKTLNERNQILEDIISDKTKLLEKYKNNPFLINLEIEPLPESTSKRYKSLTGYSALKISMDPTKITKSKEDVIKDSLVELLLSKDSTAINFVNNVFRLSILQSGFNKYSSRSPLRYFNEAALSLVLDGDYMSYFTGNSYDELKIGSKASYNDFIKYSGITPSLVDIEDHIIASLPHLLKFKNQATTGEYYRDGDYNIFKPVRMADDTTAYFVISKYGVKGIFMEPSLDKSIQSSVFKENRPSDDIKDDEESFESVINPDYDTILESIGKQLGHITNDNQAKKRCIQIK